MSRDWESEFELWVKPPTQAEQDRCENAVKAIRNAVAASEKLKHRRTLTFVQGSYRNRVNVRKESDVDIGVLCDESFFPYYPEGTSKETFGNVKADYSYRQFKDELEQALVAHFGRAAVTRGNKAFDVHETSYHVEADVAPFFEYQRYGTAGLIRCGVALSPDNGGVIHNYPERLLDSWPSGPQHYENGVSKNQVTRKSFKGVVRILKSLRNEMEEGGIKEANPIPGFLLECLSWNAPNACFANTTWMGDVRDVLYDLWVGTKSDESCKDWTEVSSMKYLFRSSQPWTYRQVHGFTNAAWDYLGLSRR